MKALVTGIRPYLAALAGDWADHSGRRFDAFEPIRSRKQLFDASRTNGNTGNYFIGEGAVEAIGKNEAFFANFGYLNSKTKDLEYLESINKGFDCFVFVTANLLRNDYDAAVEADLISRIELPIVILGIGCQRVRDLVHDLPAGTLRMLDVLKAKRHYVFSRGIPSAEYLLSRGLTNVWPTGCPSMFLRLDNAIASLRNLKEIDWAASLRIAFSGYLGRDESSVRDIEVFSDRKDRCNYVLQDEHLFHGLHIDGADDDVVYNDMCGGMDRHCQFRGAERISDIGIHVFFNTHQWRAMVAMHDVTFGKRFHGVVAGMQSGTAGLMIAIDDRMREMLDQFALPYIEVLEWHASDDKRALIQRTVANFDVERCADHLLRAQELFRRRISAIA
jgi:hypothetical protein